MNTMIKSVLITLGLAILLAGCLGHCNIGSERIW